MPEPVLITSPTRPFGWALTDLTLYGTQPTSGVTIGRAVDDTSPATEASPHLPQGTSESESDVAGRETTALLHENPFPTPVPAIDPHDVGVAPFPAAPLAPEPLAPAAPTGSGSVVAPPVVTPLQAADQEAAHRDGDSLADPSHASPADATGSPGDALAAVVPPVEHVVLATAAPVETVLGTVTDATTAVETLGEVTAPVTAAVATTAEAATDTVDTIVAAATPLPDAATTALGNVTGIAHTAVDAISLDSFGGSDPAAGLTTLIGMVESADAFDLGHAITPTASEAPASSILDALATDAAPPPLLGDDHAGVDHLVDDHGVHLGI